ncbi:hypothetical protein FACS189418_7290 [Clostridia bacterium]|nr:hypothetical protein FACS189418_7290 [Clostridia bacterium]
MALSTNSSKTLNSICEYFNRTHKNSFTLAEARIQSTESIINDLEHQGYISVRRFVNDTVTLLTKAKVHAQSLQRKI